MNKVGCIILLVIILIAIHLRIAYLGREMVIYDPRNMISTPQTLTFKVVIYF